MDEDRIARLEAQIEELRRQRGQRDNFALGQYNPLVTRGAGRVIMQLPFEDNLGSATLEMECFFQMPTQTRAIRTARVWVQRKPSRGASGTLGTDPTLSMDNHSDLSHTANHTGGSPPDPHGNHSISAHANGLHTHLIDAIAETGPSGTIALFVADDGTNYGSAITSGVTSVTNQDIKSQLTKTSGDKRLKLTLTGAGANARLQVLLLLDLRVAVIG